MSNVRVAEELVVRVPTKVGLFAEVAKTLAEVGVDVRAIGAYDKEDMAEFMLLTGDNDAAVLALVNLGATIERNDVVVVELEQRAGQLLNIGEKLSEAEINIDWMYATTGDGEHTNVVIKTSDAEKTAQVLGG
jgi:hypothetical protein